ncbi:MAG: hypothetical protein KKB30_15505 [Proteobacteria bacterium]|nr:hypothetical protein [Pseudomonadota bacterium]MBU1714686.1 hypothetical protein [Pseudomonadota bacterium]
MDAGLGKNYRATVEAQVKSKKVVEFYGQWRVRVPRESQQKQTAPF